MEAAAYHSEKFDVYRGFFEDELNISDNTAVEKIFQLFQEAEIETKLEILFLAHYGRGLITITNMFQTSLKPIGHQVYDLIQSFEALLKSGKSQVSYPLSIERVFESGNLSNKSLGNCLIMFQDGFAAAHNKLLKHMEIQKTALDFFKACRVFDPRQKQMLSRNITDYSIIPGMSSPSADLLTEWAIYYNSNPQLENFNIVSFWESKKA